MMKKWDEGEMTPGAEPGLPLLFEVTRLYLLRTRLEAERTSRAEREREARLRRSSFLDLAKWTEAALPAPS